MLTLLSDTFKRHRRAFSLAALAAVLGGVAFELPPGAIASIAPETAAAQAKPHVFVPTQVHIEARDEPPIATF